MTTKKISDRLKDDSVALKKTKRAPRKTGRSARTAKSATTSNQEAPSLVPLAASKDSYIKGEVKMSTELKNGIKAASEAFVVPGSSLIIDGDVKNGALHLAGGLAARSLLGPIGWGLVAADSFSLSVSGKHIHQHFYTRKAAPESVEETVEQAA